MMLLSLTDISVQFCHSTRQRTDGALTLD